MENIENLEEDLSNLIVLSDENGNEISFEFLDLIEYEGNEYVVLLPVEDDDDGSVVILQVEPVDEETESYGPVEDDTVLAAVFNIFKDKFKEEFNFEV